MSVHELMFSRSTYPNRWDSGSMNHLLPLSNRVGQRISAISCVADQERSLFYLLLVHTLARFQRCNVLVAFSLVRSLSIALIEIFPVASNATNLEHTSSR